MLVRGGRTSEAQTDQEWQAASRPAGPQGTRMRAEGRGNEAGTIIIPNWTDGDNEAQGGYRHHRASQWGCSQPGIWLQSTCS